MTQVLCFFFFVGATIGFCLVGSVAADAQSLGQEKSSAALRPPFSLRVVPSAELPLGTYGDYYTLGGSVDGIVEFAPAQINPFYFHGGIRYAVQPLRYGETPDQAVSYFSLLAGVGIDVPFVSWLAGRAFVAAGGYYGFLNGSGGLTQDVNFLLSAGAALQFTLGSGFGMSVGCGVDYIRGLSIVLRPFVGASYALGGKTSSVPRVFMEDIQLHNVFPVFKTYYDMHPIGRLSVVNREDQAVTDVKVSLFAPAYMDAPKECVVFPSLARGEKQSIDLKALFTEKVLDITEGTKALVQIDVEYKYQGQLLKQTTTVSLRFYDRNAMTWSDDRRVAAFVTAKDPLVLAFAKNASGIVRDLPARMADRKLNAAMSIHEGLRLSGVHYVSDPSSSFAQASHDPEAVDFLQFPRQTLAYKAGDCDDLSILYCALLESIGIETAFITTPGHIYMAFATDSNPANVAQDYAFPSDLIIAEGKAWVPIEVTARDAGMLEAWQLGAQEWRENHSKGQARLFPVRDAWSLYEPVGLPGTPQPIQTPSDAQIMNAFENEARLFVEREISTRKTELNSELQRSPEQGPRIHNRLGILYAQFGLLDQAIHEFELCGSMRYLPALINLGNISFLKKDWERARQYYVNALEISPEKPRVVLGLARVNYEKGDYPAAADLYAKLQQLDANLATQFSYLGQKKEESTRAAAQDERREVIVWTTE